MALHRLAPRMKLLLASSSPYRQQLLKRLRIPFDTDSPNVDESMHTNETPEAYVKRLAISKAQALRTDWSEHWIIGSDQCCVIDEKIVGKPHTTEKAVEQLQSRSEERRVGKECRSRWSPDHQKKNIDRAEMEITSHTQSNVCDD